MKFVTQADIKEMNRLYLELKTYAAVARVTGFSPSTVKKYIIPNYTIAADDTIIRFNKPLPDLDTSMFRSDDWGDLCILTDAEINDVKQLWNELEV